MGIEDAGDNVTGIQFIISPPVGDSLCGGTQHLLTGPVVRELSGSTPKLLAEIQARAQRLGISLRRWSIHDTRLDLEISCDVSPPS